MLGRAGPKLHRARRLGFANSLNSDGLACSRLLSSLIKLQASASSTNLFINHRLPNPYCSQALQRDDYILEQVDFSWPSVSTSVIIFHPFRPSYRRLRRLIYRESIPEVLVAWLCWDFPRRSHFHGYLRLWIKLWTAAPSSNSFTNTNSDFGSAGHLAFVLVDKGLTPPCFTTVSY